MPRDLQRTYTFQIELLDRAGTVVIILEEEHLDRPSIDGLPDRLTWDGIDYFLIAMLTKSAETPVDPEDPVTVEAAYIARLQAR